MNASRTLRLAVFPALLVTGLAATGIEAVGSGPQDPEVQTTHVAGPIHVLSGAGGNVGVMLGDDGVLMIDDKFAVNAEPIEAAIAALGGDKPAWLLNTHWHGDHTGGNAHFGKAATIVAHENVRRRLAGDAEIGGRVAEGTDPVALPVVTYDGKLGLHLNGENVEVWHLGAAHTDGDSVVWFPGAKVVHMGDLFFQIGYPFVDLDSGGSVAGVVAACKAVLERIPADAKIIPGHGEVTDAAGLTEYIAMIETSLARVREAVAAGKSVETMLADGIVDDLNARWGGFNFVPPERWVQTLASEVAR